MARTNRGCDTGRDTRGCRLLGNLQRFRGGLVFKAHRLCVSLNSRLEMRSIGCPEEEHLRRIDACITQIKAKGPSRTCNESKDEEEEEYSITTAAFDMPRLFFSGVWQAVIWDR